MQQNLFNALLKQYPAHWPARSMYTALTRRVDMTSRRRFLAAGGAAAAVDAALADWRRLDLPPDGVNAFRQGQTVSVGPEMPGNVRIYAAGAGFLGLGAIGPAGRVVPVRLVASTKSGV